MLKMPHTPPMVVIGLKSAILLVVVIAVRGSIQSGHPAILAISRVFGPEKPGLHQSDTAHKVGVFGRSCHTSPPAHAKKSPKWIMPPPF